MEIEIKYPTPDQSIFDAIVKQYHAPLPHTIKMQSRYYDTADQALTPHKASLRCRMENENQVWALKITRADHLGVVTRFEHECQADTLAQAVETLCGQCQVPEVVHIIKNMPLQPTVTMEFIRQETMLPWNNGLLALSYDNGVMTNSGRTGPISEIEIELKNGSAEDLYSFTNEIEKTVQLTATTVSKLQAARML